MAEHNMTHGMQLAQLFKDRVTKTVAKVQKQLVVWEEPVLDFDLKMDNSTIIQVWRSSSATQPIAQRGYRMIVSSIDVWYLDLGRHSYVENSNYGSYRTWHNAYLYEPTTGLAPDQAHLVLGGEACMWTETVSIHTLDPLIWPRTAAVAERLWSPAHINDINSAKGRLFVFNRYLDFLGVGYENIQPSYCEHHPEMCLMSRR
jgi:hexosaminidase